MAFYPNTSTKQIINTEIKKKIDTLDSRIESVSSVAEQAQSTANNANNSVTDLALTVADKQTQIDGISATLTTMQDEIDGKQDALEFDNEPTVNSNNPVKSGGIYDKLDEKVDKSSVKFNPEANGTDVLSTGGAYDIVQDLGGQIVEIRKRASLLTRDDTEEIVNDGEMIIENNQETYNKAICVKKGDTDLKDTSVDGDLTVSGDTTVNGNVNANNAIIGSDITANGNITANGLFLGELEKTISITDKNNATHTYNNTEDVSITSVLSAQKDINGDSIDQTYIKNEKIGVANGVAQLDSNGRLPYSQLPESAMEMKGLWDASTNTPTLVQGVGDNGDFYIVSVAGQQFGEGFNVNDRIIFVGEDNTWHRLPYTVTSAVTSVNGQTGGVILKGSDISKSSADSTNISDSLDNLQNITNATFKTALLNFCYPIGSLYWSSNSADPSTLFGGTWTQIKDKFVWAKGDSDTVNATGGSKTKTIAVENLPSHSHSFTPSGTISVTTNPTFTGTAVTSGANNRGHTHSYAHTHKYAHTHGYTPSGYVASTSGGTDNKVAGHNLTISQIPAHRHSFGGPIQTGASAGGVYQQAEAWNLKWTDYTGNGYTSDDTYLGTGAAHSHTAYFTGSAGTTTSQSANVTTDQSTTTSGEESQNHTHSVTASGTISGGAYSFSGTQGTTGTSGSGTALDIMPPYVVKYCWERTA